VFKNQLYSCQSATDDEIKRKNLKCVNALEIAFDSWQHSNNDTFVQCNNMSDISYTVYKCTF